MKGTHWALALLAIVAIFAISSYRSPVPAVSGLHMMVGMCDPNDPNQWAYYGTVYKIIIASATLDKPSYLPGEEVKLTGQVGLGFSDVYYNATCGTYESTGYEVVDPAAEGVTVTVTGLLSGTFSVDSNGAFVGAAKLHDETPAGTYQLTVTATHPRSGESASRNVQFTVGAYTPTLSVSPGACDVPFLAPGCQITVTGTGWVSDKPVTITFMGQTQTANGPSPSAAFTIPTTAPEGPANIAATQGSLQTSPQSIDVQWRPLTLTLFISSNANPEWVQGSVVVIDGQVTTTGGYYVPGATVHVTGGFWESGYTGTYETDSAGNIRFGHRIPDDAKPGPGYEFKATATRDGGYKTSNTATESFTVTEKPKPVLDPALAGESSLAGAGVTIIATWGMVRAVTRVRRAEIEEDEDEQYRLAMESRKREEREGEVERARVMRRIYEEERERRKREEIGKS